MNMKMTSGNIVRSWWSESLDCSLWNYGAWLFNTQCKTAFYILSILYGLQSLLKWVHHRHLQLRLRARDQIPPARAGNFIKKPSQVYNICYDLSCHWFYLFCILPLSILKQPLCTLLFLPFLIWRVFSFIRTHSVPASGNRRTFPFLHWNIFSCILI